MYNKVPTNKHEIKDLESYKMVYVLYGNIFFYRGVD
jgi:hypothetical protein